MSKKRTRSGDRSQKGFETVHRFETAHRRLGLAVGVVLVLLWFQMAAAGTFVIKEIADQTPSAPLLNPTQGSYESRYLSGFGTDDTFTIFFEDRAESSRIKANSTTTGANGFAAVNTATNVFDTHFVVKNWPITLASIPLATSCGNLPEQLEFQYRAWASVGNSPEHRFYVSDDCTCWTLVTTFTIPNAPGFASARGQIYYGFHDVIELNGSFYAWGESNAGQTMVARSSTGDHDWQAIAAIGGSQAGDGPLHMPESATPSGNFFDLGDGRGIGKLHVRGNDSALLLAVNTAAQTSLPPADLESAFLDASNWTWHDGTTGLPTSPLLTAGAHDLREAWRVPSLDPADNVWIIIYTADFGPPHGKALGYAKAIVPVELLHFVLE